MSLDKPDIHVHPSHETYGRIVTLARVAGKDIAAFTAELLEEVVAGRFHVLMLHLDRLHDMGLSGIDREREG